MAQSVGRIVPLSHNPPNSSSLVLPDIPTLIVNAALALSTITEHRYSHAGLK